MNEDSSHDIADALNTTFHLEIVWSTDPNVHPQQPLAKREYDALVNGIEVLAKAFDKDDSISHVAWKLVRDQYVLEDVLENPEYLKDLGLSHDAKAGYVNVATGKARYVDDLDTLINSRDTTWQLHKAGVWRTKGKHIHWRPEHTDFEKFRRLMHEFYEAERGILSAAGLDQASIGTVLQFLKVRENQIFENLQNRRLIHPARRDEVVKTLISNHTKRRLIEARTKPNAILSVLKPKIVGLTTIWADVLPVLLLKDWGAASVLSTVAGATVAALLSSNR